MMLERFKNFSPSDFIFKIASEDADLEGFYELRRQIFCEEQGGFELDDFLEPDPFLWLFAVCL